MTLKFHTQEDDKLRQLAVTVEVDEPSVVSEMKKVARKYARDLRIPGFRPGKAPFNVIRGIVGEESLRQEVIEEQLPSIIRQLQDYLDQNDVKTMGQARPSLDDMTFTPVVIKFTIPLLPVVVLGDYRSLRKAIGLVEISDDAVTQEIERLRVASTAVVEVDRPAALGDNITIDGLGYLEDDPEDVIFREDELMLVLKEGVIYEQVPVWEQLVGMTAGEEKSFDLTFPAELPLESDLAGMSGKTAHFTIKMVRVQSRTLPELDDAFAASLPDAHESLEALRSATAKRLQSAAEEQQRTDVIEGFLKDLQENVEELRYPRGAVEMEIDDQIEEMKASMKRMGIPWERYLAIVDKDETKLRDEFEDNVVTLVEKRVVFSEFARREQLDVTDAEFDAAIADRLTQYEDDEMRTYMERYLRDDEEGALRNELLSDKLFERILAIYRGEAPELAELDAAAQTEADAAGADNADDDDIEAIEEAAAEPDSAAADDADTEELDQS